MSISSLNSASSSSTGNPGRTELSERITTPQPAASADSAATGIVGAIAAGISATVSFSGKALHALESAGEMAVDGVEDLALGAWHGVEAAASGIEHVGEAVVDAVEDGVQDVVSTVKSTANGLGHYASVGAHATGEAVSELASGTVMAASAGGKTIAAMI